MRAEEIAQAIERVRGEEGVLLLTDMFGGTPSNLGHDVSREGPVEVITGVNLPMLIKLASLRNSSDLLAVAKRNARARAQRDLGRLGPPPRREDRDMTSESVTVVNQLGMHARAAAKFVHLATRFQARVRVARDRARDGRQEHHGYSAARRRPRIGITISADGSDEGEAVERWWNWCIRASARTHAAPQRHRRLARRSGRTRGAAHPAVAGPSVSDRAGARGPRAAPARREPRPLAAINSSKSAPASPSGAPNSASLFDAQLLMLDDVMLLPRAAEIIREQRVNAEWAVQQVFHEFSAVFDEVADPYLRERKGDVPDLVGRLRMNLRQGVATPRDLLRELDESSVLIADELTPSIAAQVDWTKVRGFATDAGSRTYHTAILARSLEVPAVVGLHDASARVQAGQLVIIDGTAST